MLTETVSQLLNDQVNKEFYSAYLYLCFSNYYVEQGLSGKPDAELKTNMDPLKAGLAHEQYVTSLIHAIYEAAYEAKDFRTMQFLDWFVKEQGEEETNAADLIKKMELFGSDPKGLYMLDQELAARTYTAPSLTL